ncbi:NADP oxidoreductase [Syntrophotalea acetylenivorans]|uniref:NADP oxidoreductase n=1 Tax=Syntrophotalea acetylenivorans TaxID=1842532 RepID=A0A1L3GLJ7_9BACT|nr:(2Fe-2S) ferredoxin domain-containing protein [Syntrophotalea acetylenivorans]APG26775.1 NADP oxidoreductase [Syntrophotalea acetylenivorans]
MAKINTIAELKKLREDLQGAAQANAGKPLVNVSLATCSVASGGRDVMAAMKEETAALGLDVEFVQSGCMTFCFAEPTVVVTLPGKDPVTFGYLDAEKAKTLVQKYIKDGELVDGVIPVGYERIVL